MTLFKTFGMQNGDMVKFKNSEILKNAVFLEASVVQWLCHSPCKPGVAGSIPGFSSPSDGTIKPGPVSI